MCRPLRGAPGSPRLATPGAQDPEGAQAGHLEEVVVLLTEPRRAASSCQGGREAGLIRPTLCRIFADFRTSVWSY